MATTALATRPPSDISKEDLWKKCVSMARAKAREQAQEKKMEQKFYALATSGGTSLLVGYLFTRFPQFEQVGPVPVQPIAGTLLAAAGFFVAGQAGDRMGDVGLGMLAPYLYDLGASYALPA